MSWDGGYLRRKIHRYVPKAMAQPTSIPVCFGTITDLNSPGASSTNTMSFVWLQLGPNADSTEGKYPEYDMVWADDTLNVVAIFGKAKEDSEGYDGGINAFWNFTGLVEEELDGQIENITADGEGEGASVRIEARLNDGKRVNVNVFMIRSVAAAMRIFCPATRAHTHRRLYCL